MTKRIIRMIASRKFITLSFLLSDMNMTDGRSRRRARRKIFTASLLTVRREDDEAKNEEGQTEKEVAKLKHENVKLKKFLQSINLKTVKSKQTN